MGSFPADEWLHQALTKRVETLFAFEAPARDCEEDAVHQLRVATTRLRSVLKVFDHAFSAVPRDQAIDELHWLGTLLGHERDAEVHVGTLARLTRKSPFAPSFDRSSVSVWAAQQERLAAHTALERGLESDRYQALGALLVKFAERPPFTTAPRTRRFHYKELDRAILLVCRRVEMVAPKDHRTHADDLHSVRKAAKRARYAAEVLEDAGSRRAGVVASRLHRVQQALGDHHDATELCRRLTEAHLRGEDSALLGWMLRVEQEAATEAERTFERRWRQALGAIRSVSEHR